MKASTASFGTHGRNADAAFTLLECIVTLVMLAIAAAMLVTFVGRVMERGSDSASSLGETYALRSAMERIHTSAATNGIASLSAMIGAEGASVNGVFGAYRVIHNHPVRFAGGSEQVDPGGTNLLKVTIASDRGERLTVLVRETTP